MSPPMPSLSLDWSQWVAAQGKCQHFDMGLLGSDPTTLPGRHAGPFPGSRRGCLSLTTIGEFTTARL